MKELLHKYARSLIQEGVNLQANQPLLINVDVEQAAFATIVAEEAYALGAKEVIVNWRHSPIGKLKLLHASEETLSSPATWIKPYYEYMLDQKVAILSLISANPFAMAGVDSKKMALQSRSTGKVTKFYHEAVMDSRVTWCVAAVSSLTWANLLELKGSDEEKVNELWHIIFNLCRLEGVDENNSLHAHLDRLSERTKAMNEYNFKSLHYTSDNGTDLTIEMPEGHLWLGGTELSKDKVPFNANMPTEEVFSAPKYNGVNGIVYSTKPLIYQGNRIDGFHLTFKDGKVVAFDAKEGREFLQNLIETDENSCYLGEVALVDHYSPISESNRIYFETLFDENASCHLALGAAYPTCLKDSEGLSQEELLKRGINTSMAHTDFMIGSDSLNIVGTTHDGKEVPVMKAGRLLI